MRKLSLLASFVLLVVPVVVPAMEWGGTAASAQAPARPLSVPIEARVRSVHGNQIELDDVNGTKLTISTNLFFVSEKGNIAFTGVRPGQAVALLVSPRDFRIFRVSVYAPDLKRHIHGLVRIPTFQLGGSHRSAHLNLEGAGLMRRLKM